METVEVSSCLSLSELLCLSGAGYVCTTPGIVFAQAACFHCGFLSGSAVTHQRGLHAR